MSDLDKVSIDLKTPEYDTLLYGKITVKVKPYLSVSAQEELIKIYLDNYFEPSVLVGTSRDPLSAEIVLMLAVIDECTDIMVFEEDKVTPHIDLNALLSNIQLWDGIRGKIVNYYDFQNSLNKFVAMMEEERLHERSLAAVVDGFLGDVSEAISKLSKIDISEDGFEKLQGLLKSFAESKLLTEATPKKTKKTKKEIIQ